MMDVDILQESVEVGIYKMIQKGATVDDIVCVVPVEELAGPVTTRFGVIEAVYSKFLPKETTFYLISRSTLSPRFVYLQRPDA